MGFLSETRMGFDLEGVLKRTAAAALKWPKSSAHEIAALTIPLTSDERKLTDPCDSVNFQTVRMWTLPAPLRRPLRPRPITPPAPYPRIPSPSTVPLAQPSLSQTFPAALPKPPPRPIPRSTKGATSAQKGVRSAATCISPPEARTTVALPVRVISGVVGNSPNVSDPWWPGVVITSRAVQSKQRRRSRSVGYWLGRWGNWFCSGCEGVQCWLARAATSA